MLVDTLSRAPEALRSARPLAGRCAVVTGSTSGIGLGIATALATAGADVVLNGLGPAAEIAAVQHGLARKTGAGIRYDPADMRDPDAIALMIEAAAAAFGKVDILVNNAGIQHVEAIETFPRARWDAILAIDLSAAFFATQAVLGPMKARGWGRIVNVASAHALIASPFKSAYVAAKHGVLGLTKDQPTRRFATVEEIGALTVFLCSEAAASITGTALPVDGGWTAH